MLLLGTICTAQNSILKEKYSFDFGWVGIVQALHIIDEEVEGFSILYSDNFFNEEHLIQENYDNVSISYIISDLLDAYQLDYKLESSYLIIFKKKIEKHRLHGIVIDSISQESIPYAFIELEGQSYFTQCDESGHFRMALENGKYQLIVSSIGYDNKRMSIQIHNNQSIELLLNHNNYLGEVIISEDSIKKRSYHFEDYSYQYLKELSLNTPEFGGTHDLMHTVRSLPGIQSGGGGIGGHYVRGGSNSENLILLDGAPIYYPYHTLGTSSIFNPRIVKNMQISKAGFRSQYGGRVSSILDVNIRNGNRDKWSGEASLSLQAGDLIVEGPLFDKKASLFMYAKKSTLGTSINNIINNSLSGDSESEVSTDYGDILLKYTHNISLKDRLDLTMYTGSDEIKNEYGEDSDTIDIAGKSQLKWRNSSISLNLRSVLTPSILSNILVYGSAYNNATDELIGDDEFEEFSISSISSSNRDWGIKMDISFYDDILQNIKLGAGAVIQKLNPSISFFDQSSFEFDPNVDPFLKSMDDENTDALNANKQFLFLEHTGTYGQWQVRAGIHNSFFQNEEKTYQNFEPRLNLDFHSNKSSVFSFSLARMVQYIHLLSYSSINFPNDIWYPSDQQYSPMKAWHYEIGWHKSFNDGWKSDISTYYKSTEGFNIHNSDVTSGLNDIFIDDFLQGSSKAYGLELNISKIFDNLQGNIAYGYSKTTRQIVGYNLNNSFPFQFDRRHELKLLAMYRFNNHLSIGTSAYFATGHPVLIAFDLETGITNGITQIDSDSISGVKNQQRIGNQSRIDLSIQYNISTSIFKHNLKLSVYNASNAKNPLLYFQSLEEERKKPGFSIPFLPSVHYTVSF